MDKLHDLVKMDASVVICTYNRASSLRQTLASCVKQNIPVGLSWEVLVVDNNSSDETAAVCKEFAGQLPLRYLFERRQGKSCALNLALNEARGNVLMFSDDDVTLTPTWLATLAKAADRYPHHTFFGGKVIPLWESTPPRWVTECKNAKLDYVFVRYDLGDVEMPHVNGMPVFFGANLCMRATAFSTGLQFDEQIGPQGREQIHGEETAMISALMAEGHDGMYIPKSIVYHRNTNERMTESYVRKYFRGIGIRTARQQNRNGRDINKLGRSARVLAAFTFYTTSFVITRIIGPSKLWLEYECNMALAWGRLCETVKIWVRCR